MWAKTHSHPWCYKFPSPVLVFWTFVQPLPALKTGLSLHLQQSLGTEGGFWRSLGLSSWQCWKCLCAVDSSLTAALAAHFCKGHFQSMATQTWMLCPASQLRSKEPTALWQHQSHLPRSPGTLKERGTDANDPISCSSLRLRNDYTTNLIIGVTMCFKLTFMHGWA